MRLRLFSAAIFGGILFASPASADVDSIAHGTAVKAQSASAYVIDPTQAGGGTADGSAYINSMLAEHGSIYIPNCATVIMANSAAMPDGSSIDGGGCATLKMSASMAPNTAMYSAIPGAAPSLRTLIANATPVIGNSKITVKNLTLDGALSPGNGHLVFFYKAGNVVFENNTCVGPGNGNIQDCVAFVNSNNYRVVKNYCHGVGNACYDQWDGSHDFVIMENYGDGEGIDSYCILVNGISTAFTTNTTYNGTITGNACKNLTQVGIWVGGLYQSSNGVVGDVRKVSVTGNTIDTVTSVHGIYVSDASDIAVANNIVRAAGRSCIRIGSQKPSGGTTDNITVTSNVFDACNSAGVGANAIYITTNASHVMVSNNSIVGSAQAYSAYADNTTTNVFLQGNFPAGATGSVFNQSTLGMSRSFLKKEERRCSP
jgi:hypothetical protein